MGRDAYDKVLTALQASAIGGLSLRELFGAWAGFVDGSKIDLAELDRFLAGDGITRDGAEFSWGGSGNQQPGGLGGLFLAGLGAQPVVEVQVR